MLIQAEEERGKLHRERRTEIVGREEEGRRKGEERTTNAAEDCVKCSLTWSLAIPAR